MAGTFTQLFCNEVWNGLGKGSTDTIYQEHYIGLRNITLVELLMLKYVLKDEVVLTDVRIVKGEW